jgi:hypothetical protein
MSRADESGTINVAEAEEAIERMRIELQQEMMQGTFFLFQLRRSCIARAPLCLVDARGADKFLGAAPRSDPLDGMHPRRWLNLYA